MRRLLWGRNARRDLYTIAMDYNALQSGLGDELLDRIEAAPLPLLDFPALGIPTSRRGIRKWNVRKTPFQLFYAVIGDDIEIRRVKHGRMDG